MLIESGTAAHMTPMSNRVFDKEDCDELIYLGDD